MDIEVLKNRAIQIRDERQKAANTAYRVGSLLLDMLDNLNDLFGIDENGDVYVKNNRNLYSYGTLGSLGAGGSSGGDSTPDSGSGFNEQAMWNALAATGNQKIDASHLPLGSGLTVVNGQITVSSSGAGSVTSVGLSVPTGLTVTGSPITSSGTIAIALATGYVIPTEARLTAIERITALFDIDGNGDVYVKNDRSFYSTATVGSLGAGGSSGGGSGFNEQAMWNALAASGNQKIDASHLPLGSGLTVVNGQITVSSSGAGSVTSVGLSVPTGLTVTGSPITSSGTIAIALATGYVIPTEARLTAIERITSLFDIDGNGDVYVKNDRNFYSTATVGSLGAGGSSGSSSGFDWNELTSVDASKVINISHIPSIPYSKITGAPTVSQQTVSLSSGTNNGTLKLTVGGGVTDNIAVKGLAAAAYKGVVTTLDTSANLPTSNAVKTALAGYLPATRNNNGTYTVDLTKVIFTGTIVSEEDVVIYGTSSSSGGGGGGTTIINNLTSTATDAALSANMGRYLKSLIDNIDVSGLDLSGYVSISGSQTITGAKTFNAPISFLANQYYHDGNYVVNLNNSDVIGANSIFFNDALNGQDEGIYFPRSSGSAYDNLRVYNGSILFAPNIALGSTGNTQYTVLHTGNYESYLGNYVTLDTTQTISGAKTFSATIRLSGVGIEDVGGAGLLMYRPTSGTWTGLDSSQWGVGSVDSQGVIRSSASHLVHYRGSAGYNVLDTFNAPKWTMWIYPENGASGTFATPIANNTDLNSLLEAGTYYSYSSSTSQTLGNCPYTGGNFRLWNIVNTGTNGSASNSWFAQLLLAPNSGDFFIRGHTSNGFYSWARIVKTPSPVDITVSKSSTSNAYFEAVNNNGSIWLLASTNRGVWDSTKGLWLITTSGTQTWLNCGNVGIGDFASGTVSQKLHVKGNILATGDVLMYSDRRLKTDIRPLEFRGDLTPCSYIKDGRQELGFVAQDVGALYPELVEIDQTPQHIQSLKHNGIVAVLYASYLALKRDFEDYKRSKGDK